MMNESDLGDRIAVVTGGACGIELPKPQRHQCSRRNSRSEDASYRETASQSSLCGGRGALQFAE